MQVDEDFDEVTDHAILDLLKNPNEYMDGFTLELLSALYLEIVGESFWYAPDGIMEEPQFLWILQPNLVTTKVDKTGFPALYVYGHPPREKKYKPEEIVPFLVPDLNNPYVAGYSPTRAAWESVTLLRNHLSYQNGLIGNRARPDFVMTPKNEDASVSGGMMRRMVAQVNKDFRRGRNGGVAGVPGSMDIKALTISSRDMEMLKLHGVTKVELLNVFDIPPALFESNKSRAELEAALVQHGRQALRPRVASRDAVLNRHLVPRFGDENLFLASDDPVPEDEERRRLNRESNLKVNLSTVNEERNLEGYEPVAWGDIPGQSGTPAALPIKGEEQSPAIQRANELLEKVGSMTGFVEISRAVGEGMMTPEAARAALELFFGLDSAAAARMVSAMPTKTAKPDIVVLDSADPAQKVTANCVQAVLEGKMARTDAIEFLCYSLGKYRVDAEKIIPGVGVKLVAKPGAFCPLCNGFHEKQVDIQLPDDDPIRAFWQKWFRKQRAAVMSGIRKGKKDVEDGMAALTPAEWTNQMAAKYMTILIPFYKWAYRRYAPQLDMTDPWSVIYPRMEEAIRASVFLVVEGINEYTSRDISRATAAIAEEIARGDNTIEGLTQRLDTIFDSYEVNRSRMIARTESSRAVHDAQILTATESGIVKGFEYQLSADPCPICQAVAAETPETSLVDARQQVGSYDRTLPPIHPNCLCYATEILIPKEE
jgi:HK97 family phage portal protein